MNKIKSLKAKEIMDSNGKPTVEVKLKTDFGVFYACAPSGVSEGKYEAVEVRDKDGRGVSRAIENIEKIISPALEKEELSGQKLIDEVLIQLDATKNKSCLGANAILPVSVAVCRAIARAKELPLYRYISQLAGIEPAIPRSSFNMIEGGKHAESLLAFQEFMVVPQKETFRENFKIGKEIYKTLRKILEKKFGKKNVGLSKEGALTAPIKKIEDALDLILESAEKSGYKNDVKFAIDAAASSFFEKEGCGYKVDEEILNKERLDEFYRNIIQKYPIISIEDPFEEEDFEGFAELKNRIGGRVIIIGDDLLASNVERIRIAEEKKAASGLLLKPDQIGTVTEAIAAAKEAKSYGWKVMVSNRGGETKDDFIADLAVGIAAEFIKSGAPFPKERMAKYNRLVKIEEEIYE